MPSSLSFTDSLANPFDALFSGPLSQHARLLRLATPLGADTLLVHRLVGHEHISAPFCYRLDVVSQRGDIELKTLVAQPATLSIAQPDGTERPIAAVIQEAARLGADGGVYYYQLTLVAWPWLLTRTRDSRIFQELSAIEIIAQVLNAHDFAQGRYRFALSRGQQALEAEGEERIDYPRRSYCVQYRESDYHFISRLMEEEGLWWYLVQEDDGAIMMITDDAGRTPEVAPDPIRFHRQAATEVEDAFTDWGGRRSVQPSRVSLASFDYQQPSLEKRTTLETLDGQGNLPRLEEYDYPGEYHYHDHRRGERLTLTRLEALESEAKRFFGQGGARQLSAGHWFSLSQHPEHDREAREAREFLLIEVTTLAENALPLSSALRYLPGSLTQELAAARRAQRGHHWEVEPPEPGAGSGFFSSRVEAQRRTQVYRSPRRHDKPVLGGPQTARVVGPADEEIFTDRLNRVKVQFHWDRQGRLNDQSSAWLRVAQGNADGGWGGVFVPRVGQEVVVDFLEGDPDRPLVTARVYNGERPPLWHSHGLLSGYRSRNYRGSGYNELVFDDATDQSRTRLGTDHGMSELNLGYLIHQRGNVRGAFRGQGFELRSDAYGAIRAHQGLLLTTWGQLGGHGEQLDVTEAKGQFAAAERLSEALSDSAGQHHAEPLSSVEALKALGDALEAPAGEAATGEAAEADARSASRGGRGEANRLKAPWLQLAGAAGIGMSTPKSTHLAQGEGLSISTGEDTNLAVGRSLLGTIRERLSLFVYNAGIKLFAARGKVEVQAQGGAMALSARDDLEITATEGQVTINAATEVLLTSGGAYLRIKDGNIEIHAPGRIDVKGAQHLFGGAASLAPDRLELPEFSGPYQERFTLKDKSTGQLLRYTRYRIATAEGDSLEGRSDGDGKTQTFFTRHPEQLNVTILERFDDSDGKGEIS